MAYTKNPYLPRVRRDDADLVRRGWGVRKVARYIGVSPGTIAKWVKKAIHYGYHPIPTLSSRPRHHPRQLSDELVWKIFHKRLTTLRFIQKAERVASFQFKTLQSDHGSEFSGWFTDRVKAIHRHSRVRRPNDNAHLERFNRTVQEECLDEVPKNVKDLNRALEKYFPHYNEKRLHFGLKLQIPLQVLKSKCFQGID